MTQCVSSVFHRKDYNHVMATLNNIKNGHGNYRIGAHGVGRVVGALGSEAGFAGSMLS